MTQKCDWKSDPENPPSDWKDTTKQANTLLYWYT